MFRKTVYRVIVGDEPPIICYTFDQAMDEVRAHAADGNFSEPGSTLRVRAVKMSRRALAALPEV